MISKQFTWMNNTCFTLINKSKTLNIYAYIMYMHIYAYIILYIIYAYICLYIMVTMCQALIKVLQVLSFGPLSPIRQL